MTLQNNLFAKVYYQDSVFYPIALAKKFGVSYIAKLAAFYFGYDSCNKRDWRSFLEKGLVEEYFLNEDEVINLLKSKIPQNLSGFDYLCEWCKCTTCILHKHHYPLRKSKGGQTTIKICASCHYEFHHLVHTKRYRPIKEIEESLKSSLEEKNRILNSFMEV